MSRIRTGKRKKQRTKMVVPVRVRLAGADNTQSLVAHTLDATEKGAKLAGIRIDVKVQDIIEVQHRHKRAMFRVVWVRTLEGSREKQIGIECVEPDKNIWGAEFSQKADDYEEREP